MGWIYECSWTYTYCIKFGVLLNSKFKWMKKKLLCEEVIWNWRIIQINTKTWLLIKGWLKWPQCSHCYELWCVFISSSWSNYCLIIYVIPKHASHGLKGVVCNNYLEWVLKWHYQKWIEYMCFSNIVSYFKHYQHMSLGTRPMYLKNKYKSTTLVDLQIVKRREAIVHWCMSLLFIYSSFWAQIEKGIQLQEKLAQPPQEQRMDYGEIKKRCPYGTKPST